MLSIQFFEADEEDEMTLPSTNSLGIHLCFFGGLLGGKFSLSEVSFCSLYSLISFIFDFLRRACLALESSRIFMVLDNNDIIFLTR